MKKSTNERARLAYVKGKHKQYRWLAVEKGGLVDQYIEKVYHTYLCKSREEAITILIETFDENWEFLNDEGAEGTVVEPARQP